MEKDSAFLFVANSIYFNAIHWLFTWLDKLLSF
jgi:hypothetical protein